MCKKTDANALDILARTLWGEARGEGRLGMECVANVILNRRKSGVRWWGETVIDICLKPWQFSCWNKNDVNRAKLLSVDCEDPQFMVAYDVADKALNGYLPDMTHGSDSYHDRRMNPYPKWAEGIAPAATIKNHVFYRTAKKGPR